MKKLLLLIGVALVLGFGVGWTQTGSSFSWSTTVGSPCQAPAAGVTSLCGTLTGVLMSANGAPYVSVQGPAGPPGPQGPPGTGGTGTALVGFTCTSWSLVQGGNLTANGCTFH